MAASSEYQKIEKNSVPATDKLTIHEFDLVAGADGAFTSKVEPGLVGLAVDVGVVFGDPAPNALNVTITDGYGRQIYAATGLTATQAAGLLFQTLGFAQGLTVALTGNTTAGAVAKIVVFSV